MKYKIYIVNAFCEAGLPASGNPAAVCLLDSSLLPSITDTLRQRMAADINLSETAYVEPVEAQSAQGSEVFKQLDRFKLRWFTPAIEVPLCGHATLASAAVLLLEVGNPASALHFETLSGTLTVTRSVDCMAGSRQLLQMSLPESPATDLLPPGLQATTAGAAINSTGQTSLQQLLQHNSGLTELLAACLQGLTEAPGQCSDSAVTTEKLCSIVEHVGYCAAVKYLFVVLKTGVGRRGIEQIQPDYARVEAAGGGEGMIGVIVTAQAETGEDYDLYSRFFAPWAGIQEDPVTGSAHAVLAPYWSKVLGKQQLYARQCSERGGEVWMDVEKEAGRVIVSGEAAIVEQRMTEYA